MPATQFVARRPILRTQQRATDSQSASSAKRQKTETPVHPRTSLLLVTREPQSGCATASWLFWVPRTNKIDCRSPPSRPFAVLQSPIGVDHTTLPTPITASTASTDLIRARAPTSLSLILPTTPWVVHCVVRAFCDLTSHRVSTNAETKRNIFPLRSTIPLP
ncbi:hypothetical protein VTJ04DRAFT_5568 [Mycothermus thermophilus]|uniref:uncharacterized protein n=1 Tax=Humicola insolens TaxID=85995 RepID=UPI003742A021